MKKERAVKTAMGRATNIKKPEINKPVPISGTIRDGNTSKPNVRKRIICINHACPS
jgi:hypothetical protein